MKMKLLGDEDEEKKNRKKKFMTVKTTEQKMVGHRFFSIFLT